MTASFDTVDTSAEEDWRKLAKFGVERNEVCIFEMLLYVKVLRLRTI
jgi:hypothetical protein